MKKIKSEKEAIRVVDEAAKAKIKEGKAKTELKGHIARIEDFLDGVKPQNSTIIGDKKFPHMGRFKAYKKPASPKQVVDDLTEFLAIIRRHPQFVRLLEPMFALSGKQIASICKKAKVENPFAKITREIPKESETVQIAKLSQEDLKALEIK